MALGRTNVIGGCDFSLRGGGSKTRTEEVPNSLQGVASKGGYDYSLRERSSESRTEEVPTRIMDSYCWSSWKEHGSFFHLVAAFIFDIEAAVFLLI